MPQGAFSFRRRVPRERRWRHRAMGENQTADIITHLAAGCHFAFCPSIVLFRDDLENHPQCELFPMACVFARHADLGYNRAERPVCKMC